MQTKERIQWIDVAKGICVLCIIAGHIGLEESVVHRVVFAFHVTVFFLLSGYTLKPGPVDRSFLCKKFRTLMVPYFLTCFCVLLMDAINRILNGQTSVTAITHTMANDLIRSFLASGSIRSLGQVETGSVIGAIWFFPALFFALLFTRFLLQHVQAKTTRFGIALALMLVSFISANFIWLPFSVQSALSAVFFLLLGYELRQRPEILERFDWKKCLFAVAVFLVCFFLGKSKILFVKAGYNDLVISMISAIASSLAVLYAARHLERIQWLAWVGRNSLLFFCVHLFALDCMGTWFRKWLSGIVTPYYYWLLFLLHLAFAFAGVLVILLLKRLVVWLRKWAQSAPKVWANPGVDGERIAGRDRAIDLTRGALILLILIGLFPTLDDTFRKILFSFALVAFVLYSGYFFSPDACNNIKKSVGHLFLTLGVPYAVFAALSLLFSGGGRDAFLAVLLGRSGTGALYGGEVLVGPAWFFLLLLVVRLLYLVLRRIVSNERWMHGLCLAISVFGFWLGLQGFNLPWSVDIACYALLIYHVGYCFRRYKALEFCRDNPVMYFLLSIVWAFAIYSDGLELENQLENPYGMPLLGAISGSVLLFMMCAYLARVLPQWLSRLLEILGQSTRYILLLTAVCGGMISALVARRFTEGYIYHMIAVLVLTLVIGWLIGFIALMIGRRVWKNRLRQVS